MTLAQIRGALLEELILKLLDNVGYEIINSDGDGIRNGHSGIEVCGRGEWHQIDALASLTYTPAFMYPLRLLLEAKCYRHNRSVGIEIPRNALGVLKDIQENYFTFRTGSNNELQVQRYNYHSAIFSTSNYTVGAQRFSIAHQIFLITYEYVPIMQPISETLLSLEEADFMGMDHIESIKVMREDFANLISNQNQNSEIFSETGREKVNGIKNNFNRIKGSYFGMLQGRYPLHLISEKPLPASLFAETDEIQCKIYSYNRSSWYFSPSQVNPNSPNYFKLEFNLPKEIAHVIYELNDRTEIANIKRERFSFIHLSGKIGGIQRMIKLKLDEDWLFRFLEETG
ncbi:MAG: hypothetical protein KJ666_07250 [Bacteroidetes bacterium]|nr:hypothetical protein [Bacteroidota bacterium]MBU2586060.1 hypothetical protein [Bacteroidota bacterium]